MEAAVGPYRIVVLGSPGVGKSCLCVQYITNTFFENYDPTIEESYRRQEDIDGHTTMLEIIDTAGSDEYAEMRDHQLRRGHAFLLVFSVTDPNSLSNTALLYTELQRARNSLEETPIILVANKTDLDHQRTVPLEKGREMAAGFSCGYSETSAKTGLNVHELFGEMAKMVYTRYCPLAQKTAEVSASPMAPPGPAPAPGPGPDPAPRPDPPAAPAAKKKKRRCTIL